MSQAGILNVLDSNPTIPIYFEADTGFAVALFNVIEIVGSGGITTSATGNTITIDGSGVAPDLTITGNTGGPISPVADNWDLVATNTTVNVAGTPGTLTLDFGLANLILGKDATTLAGTNNVGVGAGLYALATTANSNTFTGVNVTGPMGLTTGSQNCGYGFNALGVLQTGENNNAFGYLAGNQYTGAESRNIVIGNVGVTGESDTIRIGDNHTRFFGSGISGVTVAASAPMAVNASNQLSSLGFGTLNQYLGSNGAGVSPTWKALPATSITINGDTGSIAGSTLTMFSNRATNNSGASVSFVNAGTTSTFNLTDSLNNVFLGRQSGRTAVSGANNSAQGYSGMPAITSGDSNCGLGSTCFEQLTSGNQNVGMGVISLKNITTGNYNIGIGRGAGVAYTSAESSNIVISNEGVAGESNTIRLGTTGVGAHQQSRCFVAGITGVTVAASAAVGVDASGQLSSLGFGTSGQILTSTGAASSPTWQNPISATTANSFIPIGSSVALTTATNANITSISLSAGTWLVSGIAQFTGNPTATGEQRASISATSVTHGSLGDNSAEVGFNTADFLVADSLITIPSYILTLGGTTTVYLVASGIFSAGSLSAYGRISAAKISS